MQPRLNPPTRSAREALADDLYCRLRQLLLEQPECFEAVREGLAVEVDAIEACLLDRSDGTAVSVTRAVAAAKPDGWLLRATRRFWLLNPEAFECLEEPPAGVRDRRWQSIDASSTDMREPEPEWA